MSKALKTGYANLFKYNQETGDLSLYHWGTKILTIGSLKASSDTFVVIADFGTGELETRVK